MVRNVHHFHTQIYSTSTTCKNMSNMENTRMEDPLSLEKLERNFDSNIVIQNEVNKHSMEKNA